MVDRNPTIGGGHRNRPLAFIFDPREAFLTQGSIFPFEGEGKGFVKGVKI